MHAPAVPTRLAFLFLSWCTAHGASKFVRLTEDGQTCASSGHMDIATAADCVAAFDALEYPGKSSHSYEEVDTESRSFKPRGCYSQCFSDVAGYFCRAFNEHPTGSGAGVDTERDDYILS